MDFLLWLMVGIGQLGISAVSFNQLHATSWPRSIRKASEKVIPAVTLLLLSCILWQIVSVGSYRFNTVASASGLLFRAYLYLCSAVGLFFIGRWVYRKWRYRRPAVVVDHQIEIIDIQQQLGEPLYHGRAAEVLGAIPGNQAHCVALQRMTFHVENLPLELEGLKICHLSDFHLTGEIRKAYFQRLVSMANESSPDLIVVTGDLIDEQECLDWIDDIFGNLKARYGTYYVLGNHDRRLPDEAMLRKCMSDAGMIGVNGKWVTAVIDQKTIAIAGNELPWFAGAESLQPFEGQAALKILLSHSPDQVGWATRFGFDLMFAGHTHGGQIQIPVVGPIIAPSRHGILYASGSFVIDKMLMHVSRGISGDKCIRINCPPEVGLITLTGKSKAT